MASWSRAELAASIPIKRSVRAAASGGETLLVPCDQSLDMYASSQAHTHPRGARSDKKGADQRAALIVDYVARRACQARSAEEDRLSEDRYGESVSIVGTNILMNVDPELSASLDQLTDERLLSTSPVIVRRRVRWGECDPAQVVYAPRFADYLAAAYAWFARIVLQENLFADDGTRLVTPMKTLSLKFQHTLRPDDLFDMSVYVVSVHRRTFDLLIVAQSTSQEERFIGRLSPIVVNSNFRSVDLPKRAGEALLAYQERCPAPG